MAGNERRTFQRLKLAKPILATLDGRSALILDVGIGGAFVEHRGRANPGLRGRLSFRWQGAEIAFQSEVVRSNVIRQGGEEGIVSQSGLSFTSGEGDAEVRLQQMMATFVGHILAAHRANAAAAGGSSAAILESIGAARRTRSTGLVRYRWNGTSWRHDPTHSRDQPADGFTVAAYEDEDELTTLRETYEAADEEGRRLIRLVAELSVRNVR